MTGAPRPDSGPVTVLRCACGGGCPSCRRGGELEISRPGDTREREAERLAGRMMSSLEPEGRRGAGRRAVGDPSPVAGYSRPRAGMAGAGWPLSPRERSFFEPRLGADLGSVRVHTGSRAARLAAALDSRAFTIGRDVVFAAGEFAPGTAAGRRLLAHELVHAVRHAPQAGATIFRQEAEEPQLPPIFVPGTDLTLIPGPLGPSPFGGSVPLPGRLRLTNALGLGSLPPFVLDVDPELLVLNVLDRVELNTWTLEGTPPGRKGEPESQGRISLINPRITLNPRGGLLRGEAILSVSTGYPERLAPPTEIKVAISSSELGQFHGQLGLGPLTADFDLALHYDVDRLDRALEPVFAPRGGLRGLGGRIRRLLESSVPRARLDTLTGTLETLARGVASGELTSERFVTRALALITESVPPNTDFEAVGTALSEFTEELRRPGFELTGGLDLGFLPLTRFSATAPTTRARRRPLLEAPTSFPLTFTAGGIIPTPAGTLTKTPALAVPGVTYSSFGETSGTSVIGGILPLLDPTAISSGAPPIEQFPTSLFIEATHVRRLTDSLELGLRVTLKASTTEELPRLFPGVFGRREEAPADFGERLGQVVEQIQRPREAEPPLVPTLGLTVFGRFELLGGGSR